MNSQLITNSLYAEKSTNKYCKNQEKIITALIQIIKLLQIIMLESNLH